MATSEDGIDWQEQERLDTLALNNVLAGASDPNADQSLFDDNRPLDLGEKADDAQDFEDISDDDLPEEEPSGSKDDDAPGLTNDMDMDFDDDDDLFGEGPDAPAFDDDNILVEESTTPNGSDVHRINGGLSMPSLDPEPEVDLRALNFPGLNDAAEKEDVYSEEDFKKAFPSFEAGARLFWNDLLPPKPAYFVPQAPLKQPKALHPTKISLDLAPDQEKQFRTAAPAVTDKRKRFAEAEARGIVLIEENSSDEEDEAINYDHVHIDPLEKVGNYNMMDLEIACMDWEAVIDKANKIAETPVVEEEEEELDEWEREVLGHSSKRKHVEEKEDFVIAPRYPLPDFDNFEELTAQTAKRVVLDMNDPYLLLDIQQPSVAVAAKRQRVAGGGHLKRTGNGTFASSLQQRFNLSNDEAYDALKENHQIKVRASLGNVDVEHSMPALKLQWPYYRTKLYTREARSFHRPPLKFNKMVSQVVTFEKPGLRKKKAVKNLSTQEVFKETKDLSLSDHYATATLFEYSEEHPTVLSNFGMGNRVINYYRRKDADDPDRPVPEDKIGDVNVLLPNDRSPFAHFGMVDPGETVRTLHNAMYRAPIFKHEPKSTDFLVIRTSTGVNGFHWHIRNIDNLFVVGQQFPSTEIPGPHSRKVTNATKNRMRMIAYRHLRHNPKKELKISSITAHITDSTDMQNRQKLKEFLVYDKGDKVWRMKPNETVPEEATIRAMIKPEDVCVIDAMQVGARHLEDAGIVVEDKDDDIDEDDGDSLEQHLAPWRTSKAFLEASAEKAMLRLHGPGDPSGRGLAFSFIKTSMKGGYLEGIQNGPHSSKAARAAMDAQKNGGHGYNVKTQQDFYNSAIRSIWLKQKENLTDSTELEHDDRDDEDPQVAATPATFDDNASVFSANDHGGRVMRITRKKKNSLGQWSEVTEIIKDPRVWHQYEKRRRDLEIARTNVYSMKPTGDADQDRRQQDELNKELARLQRNKDRRLAREKMKKRHASQMPEAGEAAGSPSGDQPKASVEKTGTTRKCANCGQAGHIKTNKKLCPMLNGTMKQEDLASSNGGFGAIQAPSFS